VAGYNRVPEPPARTIPFNRDPHYQFCITTIQHLLIRGANHWFRSRSRGRIVSNYCRISTFHPSTCTWTRWASKRSLLRSASSSGRLNKHVLLSLTGTCGIAKPRCLQLDNILMELLQKRILDDLPYPWHIIVAQEAEIVTDLSFLLSATAWRFLRSFFRSV